MTTRRGSRTRLDGLTDRQLTILRKETNDWLVAKSDDLPVGTAGINGTRREVAEVAALGRLVSGLRRGEVFVPDPIAEELIARTIGETRHLDELREEYDRELGEHEAWLALHAQFAGAPDIDSAQAGGDDERGAKPRSADENAPDASAVAWIDLDELLSEDQLRIVLKEVTGALASRTGDLRLLHKHPEPDREMAEIAALARLAFWLARGEAQIPDPLANEIVDRLAEGSKDLNEWEELRERYEAGKAEHEALVAFAGVLSKGRARHEGSDDA